MSRLDDARSLARRIQSVNPTNDPAMDPRKAAHRYAMKSAWQSSLLRQFWDLVTIEPEPEQPGIVLLRVQDTGACHAVVSELDEDIRGRVWFAMDTGGDDPEPPARSDLAVAEPTHEASVMQQALAAMQACDLDVARSLLAPAFAGAPHAVDIARLWLDLLVMHLADDEAAIVAGAQLRGRAPQDPTCRMLVAVAAARLGRPQLALSWSRGAQEAELPQVLSLAGVAYAEQADAHSARRCLLRLDDLPPHPQARRRLEEALASLAEREQARAEAELTHFETELAETPADVERAARRLLTRFPKSTLAQTLLAAAAEQRLAPLWLAAQAAMEAGDQEGLLRALETLDRAGEDSVRPRIAELRAARAPERDRTKAALLAGQIAAPARRSRALRALAQAEPAVRDLVRGLLPSDSAVRWLLSLKRAQNAKTSRNLAAAAEALEAALEREAAGDLDHARRHLKTVSGALRKHDDARDLAARLASAADQVRRAKAEASIERVAAALERRDEEVAEQAWRHILGPEYEETRAALREAIDALSRRLALEASARQSLNPTLARWATHCLVAEALDEDDSARWRAHAHELHEALLRRLDARFEDDPETIARTALPATTPFFQHTPLLDDGTLVTATIAGRRLFVTTQRRAASFALPMEATRADVAAVGGRLWVHGMPGYALELDPQSLEPLACIDLRNFAAVGGHGTLVAPDGRHVWITKLDREHGSAFIVDGDRGVEASKRMITDVRHVAAHRDGVLGLVWGQSLLWAASDGQVRARTPRPPLHSPKLGATWTFTLIETEPTPAAWIVHSAWEIEGYSESQQVVLSEFDPATATWQQRLTVPGADAGAPAAAASDSAGLFVRYYDAGRRRRLAAFARTAQGVASTPSWDIPMRGGDDLVRGQLLDGGVPLRHETPTGPRCTRLSPDAPPSLAPVDDERFVAAYALWRLCEGLAPGRRPEVRGAVQAMAKHTPAVRIKKMVGFARKPAPQRSRFAVALYALLALDDYDAAEALIAGAAIRLPDAPWIAPFRAEVAAYRDDWEAVRTALADLTSRPPSTAAGNRHAFHLAAIERLRAGDRPSARRLAVAGRPCDGLCDLDAIIDACDVADAIDRGEPPDPSTSYLSWSLATVRDADSALANGEHQAVLDAFTHPAVFALGDTSALSRLARALPADTPLGWIEHVVAHAFQCVADGVLAERLRPLPPAVRPALSEQELRELVERVRAITGEGGD